MAVWNPHPLAEPRDSNLELELGDPCVAIIDLPGVPVGTRGRVMLANGLSWLRYRVRFANGVELGYLDARHIGPAGARR